MIWGENRLVGILCDPQRQVAATKSLAKAVESSGGPEPPVLVFSTDHIDSSAGTAYGFRLPEGGASLRASSLPALIFNFSLKPGRSLAKRLRVLAEREDVTLLNEANRFRRSAAFEMLRSEPALARCLLPCSEADALPEDGLLPKTGCRLLLPETCGRFAHAVYAECVGDGCSLFGTKGMRRLTRADGLRVFASFAAGRGVVLETPALRCGKGGFLVLRAVLLRRFSGEWDLLGVEPLGRRETPDAELLEDAAGGSALRIMESLSGFLPDLAAASVDLIADAEGNLYFAGFGGWDESLLGGRFRDAFWAGVLRYGRDFFGAGA